MTGPRRIIGRTGVALAFIAILAFPAASTADPAAPLRVKGRALAAREQAALLQLYTLASSLDRARAELAEIQGRLATLQRERRSARARLQAARSTLAVAQLRLGRQLRALYEEDRPGPFEILLGATSLQDVIDGFDGLGRAADATTRVIDQTRSARLNVARLIEALGKRQRTLDGLRASAAGRTDDLVAAQSARVAYIGRLQTEERLNASQIISLEARVRVAQARSEVETIKARVTPSVASFGAQAQLAAPAALEPEPAAAQAEPAPAQASASSLAGRHLIVIATAYSLPGNTASGLPTGPGVVAVDPTVIPMGTRMTIPGYGEGIAADVGTAIKGTRIDVWFPALSQARAWGAKTVTITLH